MSQSPAAIHVNGALPARPLAAQAGRLLFLEPGMDGNARTVDTVCPYWGGGWGMV